MSKSVDPIGANQTAYTGVNAPKSGDDPGVNFSNVLSEALLTQTTQSAMYGLEGFGGIDAMLGGYMPSATAGLENTLIAAANAGELSGEHLMLFMLLMMMQTGDSGNDLAPIMQMLSQMLSQPDTGKSVRQDNFLSSIESEPGIRRMVDMALSQVGTQERNKDGTIGSGNYTKYGAWYGMDGQPWCAMFVSWSADQAGILNTVVPRHASSTLGANAYKAKGLYQPRNSGYVPREGDAIYFSDPSTGGMRHVGIVVAYDPASQKVYTVEGNTSNAVRIRHYDLNNPRIDGYGRNGGTSYGKIPVNSTSGTGANTI